MTSLQIYLRLPKLIHYQIFFSQRVCSIYIVVDFGGSFLLTAFIFIKHQRKSQKFSNWCTENYFHY